MARAFTALLIAGCAVLAACVAQQKTYHICNDFDENMQCPTNTANVVIVK